MEFDFQAYLHTHLGPDHVDSEVMISMLTGGFTNFTARVTFNLPLSLTLITKEPGNTIDKLLASVILKHAPPHIASDPSQPLSVRRQDVEAAALQTLGPLLPGANDGQVLGSSGIFHAPALYHHDKVNNVLWIEDLGTDAKPLIQFLRSSSPPLTQEEAKEMGAGLGQVIHHIQKVTSAWMNSPPDGVLNLQTLTSEEIHTYLSQLTFKELRKSGIEETEAEEIARIVLKGLRECRDEEMFWGMGDFWPESVLVYRGNDSSQVKFGLIDWEYFGPSSVPAEIGMFLAHLHYHMLSTIDAGTQNIIRSFANGMCHGYSNARLSSNTESTAYPSKAFQWKTLTAHGRELINAIQLYNDEPVNSNVNEKRAQIVHAGLMSIRAAGSAWTDVDLGCLVGTEPVATSPDLPEEAGNIGRGEMDDDSRWIYEAFDALRFRVDRRA